MDVPAFHAIARIRPEMHFQIEIARRAAAETGAALPGKANVLAFPDPLGDLHLERAFFGDDMARGVETGTHAT